MADENRFGARASRYLRIGVEAGTLAARVGVSRLTGGGGAREAEAFAQALGSLKGPMMKVAQLMSSVPDLLPPEYSEALSRLQAQAPAMGPAFVRRRMQAELGPGWRSRFGDFDERAAAAASLGQVHRATSLEGEALACKLQYPDMASAVETDLANLDLAIGLHRGFGARIDTREFRTEIAARLREELDYRREARFAALYAAMLADAPEVHVPAVRADFSTGRLLTTQWADGAPLRAFEAAPAPLRNTIAGALFATWWRPFLRYGVIHGDPHLGNYSIVTEGEGDARRFVRLNLFDFGCVRVFPPRFVAGIVEMTRALATDDAARLAAAYEGVGFAGLNRASREAVTIWARFLCAPLFEDRVRRIAEGVAVPEFGRREMGQMMTALRAQDDTLRPPREFVFFDRAAIGLGAAFLRLDAEMNFRAAFDEAMGDFSEAAVAARQSDALEACGLTGEAA